MATNRIDSLDPALIRPGRIDRKIEFPLPDEKTRRMIFKIHTGRMTLATDVNLEELIMAKDDLSGADIKVSSIMFLFENEIFRLGNLYGIRFNGITRTSNESDK
jgi:ATP-dependent 26S proteasome regulatory subunit